MGLVFVKGGPKLGSRKWVHEGHYLALAMRVKGVRRTETLRTLSLRMGVLLSMSWSWKQDVSHSGCGQLSVVSLAGPSACGIGKNRSGTRYQSPSCGPALWLGKPYYILRVSISLSVKVWDWLPWRDSLAQYRVYQLPVQDSASSLCVCPPRALLACWSPVTTVVTFRIV